MNADLTSEIEVLLVPGPRVDDVRFLGGPDAARRLGDAIRAAAFPVAFPDSTVVRLPRHGLLTCSASSGECTVVLFETEARFVTTAVIRN